MQNVAGENKAHCYRFGNKVLLTDEAIVANVLASDSAATVLRAAMTR